MSEKGFVYRGKAHTIAYPLLKPAERIAPHVSHTVIFAVNHNNLLRLEEVLIEVSDPQSLHYGQHWTREQITELLETSKYSRPCQDYLKQRGFEIKRVTLYEDFIIASANISMWEGFFATKFYAFQHKNWNNTRIIRALEYSVPMDFDKYILDAFRVADFPPPFQPGPALHALNELDINGIKAETITITAVVPSFINSQYSIQNNTGSMRTSQGVYAALDQYLSLDDLKLFDSTYDIRKMMPINVTSHVNDSQCILNANNCAEANLDTQYIMAVAQNVPTSFYYWSGTDYWLDWLIAVASMSSPPKVFSISYVSYEYSYTTSYHTSFSTQAIALGVMGVTLLAASGDDGAAGYTARSDTSYCGYYCMFPASSTYVTAIGGTMVSKNKFSFTK